MKKNLLTFAVALFVLSAPLYAIVNGRSLNYTLRELCLELKEACYKRSETQQRFEEDYALQHDRMLDIINRSDNLSILLYTQEQDMTFDLAYALKKITTDFKNFSQDKAPFDRLFNSQKIEIDRYARLIDALRRIPPVRLDIAAEILPDSLTFVGDSLQQTAAAASPAENEVLRIAAGDTLALPFVMDEEAQSYRDSCICLATELLQLNADNRTILIADSTHYHEAFLQLQEAYDYTQSRYREMEKYIFFTGQTPFLDILTNFDNYWTKTKADLHRQYSFSQLLVGLDGTHVIEDDDDKLYEKLSSRGENTMLVFTCFIQLAFLGFFWLLARLVIWLICRFKWVKNIIPKNRRSILSKLFGTILYFALVGLSLYGDEYINLSIKHINTFLWLLIVISGSLLLRVSTEQIRNSYKLYTPTIFIALVIIACRVSFIPDRMLVLLFPPILFLNVLRQLYFCIRENGKAAPIDSILGWISLAIYLIALVFACVGYTFVALLILVWWYFLLAAWLTTVCISDLLRRYKERWLDKQVTAMRERITYVAGEDREYLLFGATWFYDLFRDVLIPAMVLFSLPLSVWMSLGIFDFDDLFVKMYVNPFIHLTDNEGFDILRISARSIIHLLVLFCILRYVSKAVHALWRYFRYTTFMRKHNRTTIRVNEVNLSLGDSIIGALIWLGYATFVIYVWRIPTGSLGLVAGGLSAGIGLALKDVINNFIYGVQLMGGRLHIGDWIECDGVRGKVTSINYQCVQAETIEHTEVSFLNSSLFGRNFNNLTRNHSYELTIIYVNVAYGTDVRRVREVLVKAMQRMRTKDHYGREIVDPKYGVFVVVGNMSQSAVEIGVKQYILVPERIEYVDRSKEVIYEALTAAGITFGFPRCNVELTQEKPPRTPRSKAPAQLPQKGKGKTAPSKSHPKGET